MNCKKNAKSRSDDEHRLFDPVVEKVVEIGLERLRPCKVKGNGSEMVHCLLCRLL